MMTKQIKHYNVKSFENIEDTFSKCRLGGRTGMRIITVALLHSSNISNTLLNSVNATMIAREKTSSGKKNAMDINDNDDVKGAMRQIDVFYSPIYLIKIKKIIIKKNINQQKKRCFYC